jgi:hypothetical protein
MLKLIHSNEAIREEQRRFRAFAALRALQRMTLAEIRAHYSQIELVRDALSRLLDRADGK